MCTRVKFIIAMQQAAEVLKSESGQQNLRLKKPRKNDGLLIINNLSILPLFTKRTTTKS